MKIQIPKSKLQGNLNERNEPSRLLTLEADRCHEPVSLQNAIIKLELNVKLKRLKSKHIIVNDYS